MCFELWCVLHIEQEEKEEEEEDEEEEDEEEENNRLLRTRLWQLVNAIEIEVAVIVSPL
jgi:hypothetical protein